MIMSMLGCASVQSGSGGKTDDMQGHVKQIIKPGKVVNGLRDVYIPRKVWDALGLGKRAMLVSMDGAVTSIYHTDKLPKSKRVKNAFPKGRKLINEVHITQTHNSPDCFSYRDGEGNQKWWPRDCPK